MRRESVAFVPRARLRAACMVLVGGLVFAVSGAIAQTPAAAAPATAAGGSSAPEQHGIDGLIAHLHDSLKITAQQESAWQQVASIMRQNNDELSRLAQNRAEQAKSATAVDDLKSYAEISEAHARGTQRLLPAFESLYTSMSPEQQHLADEEFRGHFRGHHRR